ncbi:ATP-binding cassette domain-containing protein [Weissella ceti]|uniref:ATP-binding cassette domain-containing protein n=1 Tax=Weissella ceti TaxID=759620 RepID=A0ABT3E2I3_9LACO|nr:ATP-binding cassette domain-containing protein [Weissella ceti]MCW0952643.1 ATP-binding cassette domain-containing protein [Weissella ceti]QVK12348.1 ATP-binding cassette domain-containing protein [Weissella ceti]
MSDMSLELIDATVTVNQGTPEERNILNHVNLQIAAGEFVTVLGSNGAGKSTLLNVIAGSLKLTSGEIWLGGENVTNLNDLQRTKTLARVFQDPKLGTAPRMTVAENLLLSQKRGQRRGLRNRGLTAEKKAELATITETMGNGLSQRLDVPTGKLSGGQRQALSFLMATQVRPDVLLLDEHTAALDPKTSQQLMTLTNEKIREAKLTAMMITHDLNDALIYGDRLLVIENGGIGQDFDALEKAKLTVADLLAYFNKY